MGSMDKINIKPLTQLDLEVIQAWDPTRKFDFEGLADAAVAKTDAGIIVGFGGIKIFAEAVVALNPTISVISKSYAYKLLFRLAVGACLHRGIQYLHAFIKPNISYGKILKKLGFETIPEEAFVLNTLKGGS